MKNSLLSALMVCSLTLTAVAAPALAFADSIDDQIEQQDQKINSLKGQQADAQSQIDSLEAEIETVSAKVASLEAKQVELGQEAEKLQDKIATLKLRIAKREEAIQKQARDVQVNGQSTNFIDAVLEADSLTDVIGRVQAMTTIVNANNDLVEQQKQDKQDVEDKVKENESKIQEVAANQAELSQQRDAIAAKQADLNVLKANLAAEQATAEKDKDALNKKKQEAEAEKARILKEQQEAAAAQKAEEERQAAAQSTESTTENTTASTETATSSSSSNTSSSNTSSSNSSSSSNAGSSNTGSSNSSSSNSDSNSSSNNNSTGSISTGGGKDHSSSGNMYAWGQCTWYVKSVAPWVGTYWGNGAQWGASAAADGYTVNGTPAAGAVVVFAAGQSVGGEWTADPVYGHVAYVESYNPSNNTITISQGGMGFDSPGGPNRATMNASGYTYIHR
ncbi:peptidoglycan DL-endopeptidase CwlO [Enterococcus sp. DIV0421]|uniref:CHAP domain-containing protein n=1 Tax=Enterococcus sp. DIV0421 TaxID=2774688 RepID=UPI003F290E13